MPAVAAGGKEGHGITVAINDIAEVDVVTLLAAELPFTPAHGDHGGVIGR